ncbi:ammonia channel protein [Putridiphycobacter roseus]|uniref:Ammonium transporter n=1 Tax=Putridiphycobacter roseus TaxID=2219161 RepID=A0A2W1MV90_9FLAO|nr:ammonium transporter [Putridiphycobacter roseus]PZE16009.1 ammonia channel protein [Putridiphycobacter roseus]
MNNADIAWMLTATCLVFFMTPGLSFFYGGMVSKKNIISTMLQSFVALGIVTIWWVLVGFSLCFGDSVYGFIGSPMTFLGMRDVGLAPNALLSPNLPMILFAMFQLKFAVITPALITGSFAERINFKGYLLFILLFSTFIYAPLCHMTWHPDGLLKLAGVLDYAGGTVVHMSAGIAALTGAMVLGSRINKTNQPVNIPFILLGTAMLWFGWFGFNAGSAFGANGEAAMSFATTTCASAAAMVTWVLIDLFKGRKVSAVGTCIGAVVGLVAITPAAGFVTVLQSLIIGVLGACLSYAAIVVKNKTKLDDTLDVFPTHGIAGIFGMVATAVFAKDVGLIYGETETFIVHLVALIVVFVSVFFISFLLYKITNKLIPMRVNRDLENFGLDQSQHNEQY